MKVSRKNPGTVAWYLAARPFLRTSLSVFTIFAGLPAVIKKFWHAFLPSPHWISVSNQAGWISGLLIAALFFPLVVISAIYDDSMSDGKKIVVVIFGPIMGCLLGLTAVAVSIPMVFALALGHPVEIGFAVEKSDGSSDQYCTSPVKLQDLPFLFNEVCDVTDTVRHGLTRGSHVVIVGWGTTYGVFPESIRAAD